MGLKTQISRKSSNCLIKPAFGGAKGSFGNWATIYTPTDTPKTAQLKKCRIKSRLLLTFKSDWLLITDYLFKLLTQKFKLLTQKTYQKSNNRKPVGDLVRQ